MKESQELPWQKEQRGLEKWSAMSKVRSNYLYSVFDHVEKSTTSKFNAGLHVRD